MLDTEGDTEVNKCISPLLPSCVLDRVAGCLVYPGLGMGVGRGSVHRTWEFQF